MRTLNVPAPPVPDPSDGLVGDDPPPQATHVSRAAAARTDVDRIFHSWGAMAQDTRHPGGAPKMCPRKKLSVVRSRGTRQADTKTGTGASIWSARPSS